MYSNSICQEAKYLKIICDLKHMQKSHKKQQRLLEDADEYVVKTEALNQT